MLHRSFGRTLVLTLALAAVGLGAVAKSGLSIVIFSDNPAKARALLDKLAARGYSNPEGRVRSNPNREFNIKYGAAPLAYVDEIATYTEGRYDVELRRSREFDSTDLDVFINLPFETQAGTNSNRASLRVVVSTDDEEQGEGLLDRLAALGYTNDENYVEADVQEEAEVRYGSAAPVIVDEIVALVDEEHDVALQPRRSFEPDDDDVFIYLPAAGPPTPPERNRVTITVFAANQKTGSDALELLAELGFTNRRNEVLADPNASYSISYGACPKAYIDEIEASLEKRFKRDFQRLQEFGDDQRRIFIHIPVE
jgi:SOS response regulatory protein OraA/RecX